MWGFGTKRVVEIQVLAEKWTGYKKGHVCVALHHLVQAAQAQARGSGRKGQGELEWPGVGEDVTAG